MNEHEQKTREQLITELEAANKRIAELESMHRDDRDSVESLMSASLPCSGDADFLAGLSYEIRSHLNGLMGMLEMVQQSQSGAEQSRNVALTLESSRMLAKVLGRLLYLLDMNAGSLSMEEEDFDLAELLQSLSWECWETAIKHKVTFRSTIDPSLPGPVKGDSLRMRQILTCLVNEVLSSMAGGELHVRVRMLENDSDIFLSYSIFWRDVENESEAEIPESTRQGCPSLGLAVMKKLISLMKGRLDSRTSEDGWRETRLTMPLKRADQDLTKPLLNPSTTNAPQRVLVVEDDQVSMRVSRLMLESMGYAVVGVENGQEALQALGRDSFDCVVMDIQMPIMDGMEATRRIRTDHSGRFNPSIPIIAVTAYAMAGDREHLLETGANEYIAKPLDKRILRRTLVRLNQN